MNVLGVIPARGGSKGVTRKNLRLIADEPLIKYSIDAALDSKLLTNFLTTTEDMEIASVAESFGSDVLIRPKELADDDSPMVPVIIHALEHTENRFGIQYDAIVLIQPPAPIRTGNDIDEVIKMIRADSAVEGIISVCDTDDTHPARMYELTDDEWMKPLWQEWETMQRQNLPRVYYRNGSIYAVKRDVLLEKRTLMPERKKAYVMPRKYFANIDDERDLLITDKLVREWKDGNL